MSSRSYRILVVDDLPDNLFLLETALEQEGYIVEVATGGKVALSQINCFLPDLVLLDVMMQDMSGYEVVQQIRQQDQFSSTPILLVTGNSEESTASSLEVGANGYIPKPIDFDKFPTQIQAALGLQLDESKQVTMS
jgi:CheY-like chemotaxis protein